MNRHSPSSASGEAKLHFGDNDYVVMRPGSYVVCAVSGKQIPIESLRYWDPRAQKAFAGPTEAMQAWVKRSK